MGEKQVWVVRTANAETGSRAESQSVAAIGAAELGDLARYADRDSLKKALHEFYPDHADGAIAMWAGQLYRFVHEVSVGDYVLTPLKGTRDILAGTVEGAYVHDPSRISQEYPNIRPVVWHAKKISRDDLPADFRNSLGAISTLFSVTAHRPVLEAVLSGAPQLRDEEPPPPFYEETKARADELIQDCLSRLDWYQFQELVAGVLAAAGYKGRVSPPGPDRGVDIVAHPDRFGFQEPVVKVQVKHRRGTASAPEVRSFVGTLRERECGLFVSSGGFTSDALREPERTSRRLRLMDGDELVDTLIEHYEKLGPEIQALVPLRKVHIPYQVEK